MLEFLVTSKTRRRLLQLLWEAKETGSATRFAELAGVGFASAYRELQAMQSLNLVVSTRDEGAEVYAANGAHPSAAMLRTLVAPHPEPAPTAEARRLRARLKALGAPLQQEQESVTPEPMDPEEALVRGACLARRDPDVARALPVCLYRQRHTLTADTLHNLALQLRAKHPLGFFLELTARLSGNRRLAQLAEPLFDRRRTAPHHFFLASSRSHRARRRAEEATPEVARKWGFLMNMSEETFQSTFDKFADAA